MFKRIIDTDHNTAPLIARWILALVILPHGLQKTLGWFGGYGLEGTLGFFTEGLGIPFVVALAVIAIEVLGPVALAAGFLTRAAALSIAGVMVGAVVTVHAQNGFFMNWSGDQAGQGFEYHLLVIGLATILVLRGGGAFSVDRALATTR